MTNHHSRALCHRAFRRLKVFFVDQWDWEKVITREQRNIDFLKDTVKSVVKAIAYTKRKVGLRYNDIAGTICEEPYFITTQELADMYPDKNTRSSVRAKERAC